MSAPYSVQLDEHTARELATRGATLLLLDMPEGCALGLDQQTFLLGPRFLGIKMVPPGAHLVSYSASSGQGDFGPTTAFFLFLKSGQVVVRRWNAEEEVLHEIPDADEAERCAAGVRAFQFDSSLAPYDLRSYNRWRELSNFVTADVIDSVQPLSGNINILAEGDPSSSQPPTQAESALEKQLEEGRAKRSAQREAQHAAQQPLEEEPAGGGASVAQQQQQRQDEGRAHAGPAAHAGRCYYTPLPRLVKRAGLTPAELTALNLDKSPLLEEVLRERYKGSEDALLGEFQFCFLAFLLGQSMEGFAQWRDFLQLLLGCVSAPLGPRCSLFVRFLTALHRQLQHSLGAAGQGQHGSQDQPLGAIALPLNELLQASFLRSLTTQFFQTLHEERPAVPAELAEQAQRVSALLARTLGWGVGVITELDGSEDEDDEGPVLVLEGEARF